MDAAGEVEQAVRTVHDQGVAAPEAVDFESADAGDQADVLKSSVQVELEEIRVGGRPDDTEDVVRGRAVFIAGRGKAA